jgi:hypothetical protein
MFNLLVSFGGWDDHADTISNSRIYINSDDEPGSTVLTKGKLDIAKIGAIPALLMSETTGREPCIARVGRITDIHQGEKETRIEYLIDTRIATMSSHGFNDYANQLGTSKGSLTHTHWEVCSGDLYRAICLIQQQNSESAKGPEATVFSTKGIYDQEDDLVSVMMPFRTDFDPVYQALKKAVHAVGLRCERADDIWVNQHVIQDIVDLITKARVVICDCSAKNANVFYELGIAHAMGKEVIMVAQSNDDIPFDLQHLRYVPYYPNNEGLARLTTQVQDRLKTVIG